MLSGCPELAASAGGESEVWWFVFFFCLKVSNLTPIRGGWGGRGKTNAVFDVRDFSAGEVTLERRGRQGLRARVL